MNAPDWKWRLTGGYSKFIEGSELELRAVHGPLTTWLSVFPASLHSHQEPVEFVFKVGRTFSGEIGEGLRWRLTPESRIRALLLFAGTPFLGNFRVPAGCFAVQWEVEGKAEGSLNRPAPDFLLGLRAGTRVSQSWVRPFEHGISVQTALLTAWEEYRNPFDPSDVYHLSEGEVIRWTWEGHAQLTAGFQWGIGTCWAIPGHVPLVDVQKEIGVVAGLGANFFVREEGEFSLQLRKRAGRISFHLRKDGARTRGGSLSVGAQLNNPVKFNQFGFSRPPALKLLSETLGQPLANQINRVCEESLTRRLALHFVVSTEDWRKSRTVVDAVWREPSLNAFMPAYCNLLKGRSPEADQTVKVTGRLQSVKGKRVALDLGFLDWLRLGKADQRESVETVTIGPRGDLVVERVESLERTAYRWDELQFLKLIHRESCARGRLTESEVWSWGIEEEVSRDRFRNLLRLAAHSGVLNDFRVPAKPAFPQRVRFLVVTRFAPEGLNQVREASPGEKWKTLVRALELAEPDRYGCRSFWRDWIESEDLRDSVDRDPIQSDLVTRYPLPDRTQSQRTLVVMAYRRARRFLTLLEHWKRGDNDYVLSTFESGMEVPIFFFFHLLCPAGLRTSGALMTGDVEQTWGDLSLLE